jgi:hypothetical protein
VHTIGDVRLGEAQTPAHLGKPMCTVLRKPMCTVLRHEPLRPRLNLAAADLAGSARGGPELREIVEGIS